MVRDNKIPALWQTQNDSPTPRRKHVKLQCFYGATLRPKSQVTLSGLHQCIWIQASISKIKVECLGANTTEIRKGKIRGEPPFLHTSESSPSPQISLCNLADRSKAVAALRGQMLPQITESAKACRGAEKLGALHTPADLVSGAPWTPPGKFSGFVSSFAKQNNQTNWIIRSTF